MTAPTEELRSPLVRRLVEALDDAEQADRAMLTMLRSVSLAETLRLLPPGPPASSLTEERVGEALVQLARLGVGRRPHRSGPGRGPSGGGELDLLTAIEESPLPGQEWVPIADLLGDDLLARLLGISVSSLVRYRRGDRPTPDAVAERPIPSRWCAPTSAAATTRPASDAGSGARGPSSTAVLRATRSRACGRRTTGRYGACVTSPPRCSARR